ncbi:hypothetical protein BH23VER1_BH23VER1_29160 [soil metagenome]
MLGRRQEINLQLNQILDALLIALAFWVSHSIRYFGQEQIFAPLGRPQIQTIEDFFWLVAIMAPFMPIILEFQGFYNDPLQKTVWKSLRQLLKALLWMGLIIGGCVIFAKWQVGSRFFLPIFVGISGVFLLAKDAALRSYLHKKVRSEGLRERVVVAGTPEAIEKFLDEMPADQRSLITVVARIDLSSVPVSGLVECMHNEAPERVIFATAHVHFDKIEAAIHACETEGVEAWLAADFIQTSIARPNFDVFGGRPMLVFRCTPEVSWALLCKNVFDCCGAVVLLVLTSPLWVFAYAGIKFSSPGPAIFRQSRSGKNGKAFDMLKFRTMHTNAEDRRAELEGQNQMSGPVFKVEKDPRIFPFGALLRRFSIDELPQLLNVLVGQMSLVGPRPLPVYEIARIENSAQRRRLSVKPGLTCLWQISGRNKITSFEEWVALDLKYIDNWSIWLDFRILLRTIPAVVFGNGAR